MPNVLIACADKATTAALHDALVAAKLHLNDAGDWRVASPEQVAMGVMLWTIDAPQDFIDVCSSVAGVTVTPIEKGRSIKTLPAGKAAWDKAVTERAKIEAEKLEADDLIVEE